MITRYKNSDWKIYKFLYQNYKIFNLIIIKILIYAWAIIIEIYSLLYYYEFSLLILLHLKAYIYCKLNNKLQMYQHGQVHLYNAQQHFYLYLNIIN